MVSKGSIFFQTWIQYFLSMEMSVTDVLSGRLWGVHKRSARSAKEF